MQIANAPSTSPRDHYLRNLAILFCDHLSAEFHNRSNPESRKGIDILALLTRIITETRHVQHVVDRLMFWSDMPQSSSSPNLAECLELADEDIFPNIRTLLRIGYTLPVGSCEAEHSFSCLQWVTTYLDNRMGEGRLSGFTLMNMNHGMEIDLETVCKMFIERNKRKMFSSYILYQ